MADIDVIKFRNPILSRTGATDFRMRMLVVDMQLPLVKLLYQQAREDGTFVENGETFSVRNEGVKALEFLARPEYAAVIGSLTETVVAGENLPAPADVVTRDVPVVPIEPLPVEPSPVVVEPVVQDVVATRSRRAKQ